MTSLRAGVRTVLGSLVAAAVAVMMLVTVVEVIGRYLLNSPVPGSNEMIELALGLAIMAGMPLVSAQGTHIQVSLIESFRAQRWYAALQFAIELFSLAIAALIAYAVARRAMHLYSTNENSQVLRYIVWSVVTILALFWIAVAWAHARRLIDRRGEQGPKAEII